MEPRLYMHFSPKIVLTVQLNSPSQDNNKHWFCAIIWASLFQKINDEKWQIITFIASFNFRKYSRIFRSFDIRNMRTLAVRVPPRQVDGPQYTRVYCTQNYVR